MNKNIHTHLFILMFTFGISVCHSQVAAQSYPEGRAAYIRGDFIEAFNILSPLAENGDAEAQKMLGIMYDYGQGVDVDPEEALQWYIRSAEQGQTAVQYQVGAKYFKGESIPQNYSEAARWWKMAADGGQVDAQFNLGLMYFRGLGVTQDDEMASQMFEQAASQNHGQAQYSLGVVYAFGRGVDRDYDIARDWFTRAADKGIAQAQYNLGIFYENGNGVEPDLDTALDWYQRAAAQGLNEAIAKLDELGDTADDPQPPLDNMIETGPQSLASNTEGPELTPASKPEPRITDKPVISAESENGIHRESWLLDQPPDYYTIQIGSVTSEQDLIDFLKRHNLAENSAYIQIMIDGVTRFNAFYGIYSDYAQAQQAIPELPGEIQRASPWIRNIRILHGLIN